MAWAGVTSALVIAATAAPALAGGVLAAQVAGGDPLTDASRARVESALAAFMALGAVVVMVALLRRGELRDAALVPARRDASAVTPAALVLLALAAFLIGPLATDLAASLGVFGTATDDPSLRRTAIATLVSTGAAALVGALGIVWLGGAARRAGLTWRPVDAAIGVVALLLAFPVIYTAGAASRLTAFLAGRPPAPALAHETLRALVEAPWTVWWWATVLGVVVLAPFVEEVIYRGFFQTALLAGGVPAKWCIVVVSALFTLVHAPIVEAVALPQLFVLSLGLGYVVERTGRLGPAVVMHAAFNVLNIAIAHVS